MTLSLLPLVFLYSSMNIWPKKIRWRSKKIEHQQDSTRFILQNKTKTYTQNNPLFLCVFNFLHFVIIFFHFFLFAFITNYDYYDDDGNDFGSGWNPWNHHPTNNKFVSSFSISCYCSVWLKSIDVIFLINYNIGIYFNNWFFFL